MSELLHRHYLHSTDVLEQEKREVNELLTEAGREKERLMKTIAGRVDEEFRTILLKIFAMLAYDAFLLTSVARIRSIHSSPR